MTKPINAERRRLAETASGERDWKRWGTYLSERAWGTVREDYSPDGDAWNYFPHDHARSRAYRWSEDGIGGFCNRSQLLCLGLALWNEQDPILKERLFGLSGPEGNHGEDVKEYYFYLDNTPTHAYAKILYKYPQAAYPYERLVEENRRRSRLDPEFELVDALPRTFAENRYFDVFIEYAKIDEEDFLCRITACNRGPDPAPLHLLPHLWFRNTWSWGYGHAKPELREASHDNVACVRARNRSLGERWWSVFAPGASSPELLFTENETNRERLFGVPNSSPFVKDAIHEAVVHDWRGGLNARGEGTKAAAHVRAVIRPGASFTVKIRCKQFYHYDVEKWLEGDPATPPPPPERKLGRNHDWTHLNNRDVLSMPDTWEYPWYASWDLAFHMIPMSLIDPDFAKGQLILLTREWYMHPNGQLPAYEWNFGDVNPPVLAWAAFRVYKITRNVTGEADTVFLEKIFLKLLLNFTWWVNRKDAGGHNIFQGGFLGLDNIGVFDRSAPLPSGGRLDQADGTAWMGMYCLNMLAIALELARTRPAYEDMATKFFEHFVYIAHSINHTCAGGLWHEKDGFYYDALHTPEGEVIPLKIRSFVGLIPLFAVETLDRELLDRLPDFRRRMEWFLKHRPHLMEHLTLKTTEGAHDTCLLALVNAEKLEWLMHRMLDPNQFLSEYGLRSLSREHERRPVTVRIGEETRTIGYEPAESKTGLFGGNSNWRGPIWFPLNFLMIESLQKYHHYFGDRLRVEYPVGSGQKTDLWEVAAGLSRRLCRLFLREDATGRRPFFGDVEAFRKDPHWRDYVWFHEYFHGDRGTGLGAAHQTGWTALVAKLLQQSGGARRDPAKTPDHASPLVND